MTSQTEDRILLEERLRDVLGLREAATLLGYLPLTDDEQLPTSGDLRETEARLDGRLDRVEQRLDRVEQRLDAMDGRLDLLTEAMHALRVEVKEDIVAALVRTNRTTVLAMLGTIVGSSTLALAVLRFAG